LRISLLGQKNVEETRRLGAQFRPCNCSSLSKLFEDQEDPNNNSHHTDKIGKVLPAWEFQVYSPLIPLIRLLAANSAVRRVNSGSLPELRHQAATGKKLPVMTL
jgi:hypothetical protein